MPPVVPLPVSPPPTQQPEPAPGSHATPGAGPEPHYSAKERWGSAAPHVPHVYLPHAPRPRVSPRFAVVAVVVIAVLIIGGLIAASIAKSNADAAFARQDAARFSSPQVTGAQGLAPTVAVVGDQTAAASGGGVTASERWPALLGAALRGTVTTFASRGAGYTKPGVDGKTFAKDASAVSSSADVVIVFGGLNDAGKPPLDVLKAATRTFAAVRAQAPDAKILVVGPVALGASSTSAVQTLRNALKSSAGIARATWLDPLDENWLATGTTGALSAADEKTISGKLTMAVQSALR